MSIGSTQWAFGDIIAGMNARSRIVLAVVAALVAAFLGACMTTSGTAYQQVVAAEAPEASSPPPPPPPPEQGLQVVTDPDRVEVYLNGTFVGTTPLSVTDLAPGPYQVRLSRPGFYDLVAWIDYRGGSMRYQVELTPITGFVLVQVTPSTADISLGSQHVGQGMIELPEGSYTVMVRAFGYQDYRGTLYITGPAVVPLQVSLQPAPFEVQGLAIGRSAINPGDPGVLGDLEAFFSVTAPGTATAMVLDSTGAEVRSETLPTFTTWNQRWRWHPPGSLADGDYRLRLSAQGAAAGTGIVRDADFRIDRSISASPRATWSGGAGLLYAPGVDTLPPGSWQLSLLVAPQFDLSSFRAPAAFGLRAGLGAGAELDLVGGAIFESSGVPFFAGAGLRWELVPAAHPFGAGVALDAKLALQGLPGSGFLPTDTFANFSGASIGVPVEVTLGPVSLLGEAAIIASPWHVDYLASGPVTTLDPAAWLYWRAGVMATFGPVVAGLSGSVRSGVLPGGLFAIDLPVELGAELHYLLPGTHLVLSLMATGEAGVPGGPPGVPNFYFSGGAGLGVIY